MKNLKVLRLQRGLSQQKLADILHISQQSIYKYEHDITSPDIDTLKSMATFFDTSIDYIVGYTDYPRKVEHTFAMALNEDETSLILKYQHLTAKRRALVHSIIDSYSDDHDNTK